MDGGRGYFSASPAANPGGGSTRTRPVSAGTRLRQKPAAAGAHQDFFASLGIDSQPPRVRTGSSTSTSSNRSFNNITLRGSGATAVAGSPAAAALAATSASSTSTSTFGGWQSGASGSSIGGISRSSQRSPLPDRTAALMTATAVHAHPPVSTTQMMGSGDSMSVTTTTTTTTTNVSGDGMNAFSGAASGALSGGSASDAAAFSTASQPKPKPTQLFSMEDADDLFSDDGWGCDSPSTVLSNPMEETESASAAAKETTQDEDFGWGDDDDAFVSPVAKPAQLAQPPQQQHQVHFEEPAATQDMSFAAASTSSSAFETQHVTVTPPLPVAVPSASLSVSPTDTSAFENKAANATAPPPPVAAPPTELLSEDSSHSAEQAWDSQWDQQVSSNAEGDVAEAKTTSVSTVTATTTTTTTRTTRTERFGGAAVELASPAGAAGEFWGDPDDYALFDHDDHADEEWDESIKEQGESQDELALHAHAEDEILAVASAPTPEASSSLAAPPPPATATFAVASTREGELMSAPENTASVFDRASYSTEYHVSSTVETLDRSFGDVQESTVTAESATETVPSSGLPDPTSTTYSEHESVYASGDDSQEVGTAAAANETSFSSAMDARPTHEDDLNVFPEAPPAVRFLHTPTGTGGPFGRVPSPQGHDGPSLGEEYSNFDASDGHGATEATARTTNTGADEKREEAQTSELYAEASVRWDLGSTAASGLEHAVAEEATEQYPEEMHHEIRQGQSDEEERDSVVSFSGGAGNSSFPSAGRPSSLYGGSQSSFASHRMYQSSTASTDHDGSSIASFGVSSAGATFGGSERVSEGGAFSDGTASETPSMVDSSNASTAFGTDFPSVSEGQFSAPGTTIGGSDNASDGGFSDGNASETTSMCESVNTNSAFVSEFRATTGHYVTETVQHRDVQESFASSTVTGSSTTTFSASAPPAVATMFGGDDSLTDANPFASASSAFPSRSPSRTPPSPPAAAPADRSFNQSSTPNEEEYVPSAASLFGATAGADVPNLFSSFGARPAAPTAEATPVVEHELPTSDASDLFGSAPAASGFGNSFNQPAHQSYNSSYQSYDQVSFVVWVVSAVYCELIRERFQVPSLNHCCYVVMCV
ncbi:hypothetical protein BBJ28_00012902 [Nothophytophthora sp. Chile5]|nr:hypothetical protein BBJ28_00012902 [Nothophytophthora sp. Chile5]